MRKEVLFNEGWLFHEGDIDCPTPNKKGPLYMQSKTERMKWGPASIYYNDATDDFRGNVEYNCRDAWDSVELPHDYVIKHAPDKNENNALGYFKYNNAWYRKHYKFPDEDKDKRYVLRFDGVATNATVYFNGCLMAHNFCGYTGFEVDITDYIVFGSDNVLAVYVNTQNHEGWWYEGGGIYRDVYLVITDRVAIETYGVYVKGTPRENDWKVDVEASVFNESYEKANIEAVTEFFDESGKSVVKCKGTGEVLPRDKAHLNYSCEFTPELWDIDRPYLYKAVTKLYKNGELCDEYETKTGFRTYYADPDKGFFLNGRHVKIKGVCAHQDCGLTGKAVSDNVNRYKIGLIKQMGANGYRTSHYPQNSAIMDALDELGFIVMEETRWYDSTPEAKAQLEFMVKRDRNRPSVFFWSIGNEEPYHVKEQGANICRALKAEIEKLDTSRIIMTAVSNSPEKATVYDYLDAVGVNYNLHTFDLLHEKFPKIPVFSSECCATGTTRGWYRDDCPDKGYINAYDTRINNWWLSREETWNFMMEREYILGAYQWTAFEHRGETVWPRLCSQSGAIDLYLQKKDAFYQNQSHWLDTPMIHMLPHWTLRDKKAGEEVNIWIYTNCEEVELKLNGKSLGKRKTEKYKHLEWSVPYEPGKIEAVGFNGGKEAAHDENVTAGSPVKLCLRLENEVTSSGRDTAIITCYTVDENGTEVPDAAPTVDFYSNGLGRVIATGSDVSDHNPVTETSRKMRAGRITVAVKAGSESGTLSLYAESEGLVSARLDIEI